jgi:predicted Zn-dependent peptidase
MLNHSPDSDPTAQALVRHLDNGVTLVAVARPTARLAALSVDVAVGARYESPKDSGLSHVLEHMVFQGCEGFETAEAVNEAAERMGTALDAWTSRDTTHFEHIVAPERLRDAADLLGRVLRAPRFLDLDAERAIILEEALDEVDERGRLIDADALSRRALWPDHALGQTVIGERKNIERFSVDDLVRHHAQHYVGSGVVVGVAADLHAEALLDLLSGPFSGIPVGARAETSAPTKAATTVPVFVDDPRSQVDCRLVWGTPGGRAPSAAALTLAQVALDDGLASRLHRRFGAQLGLAYEQWAQWERYPDVGAFEIGAILSPAKVPTFFEEADALFARLVTEPPRGDELERVRFRARFSLVGALERSEAVLAVAASARLYGAEPLTVTERLADLEAVTPEDLAEAVDAVRRTQRPVAVAVGELSRPLLARTRATLDRIGARRVGV